MVKDYKDTQMFKALILKYPGITSDLNSMLIQAYLDGFDAGMNKATEIWKGDSQ